jgi:hypothetical protein
MPSVRPAALVWTVVAVPPPRRFRIVTVGTNARCAVITTVAVSEAAGPDRLSALTEGFQAAFAAAVAFPLVGLVCAVLLLRRRPSSEPPAGEPADAATVP